MRVETTTSSRGVAFDSDGNVYVAGQTSGTLNIALGGVDGFLRKYDSFGIPIWTEQLGTSANDSVLGVATDSDGNGLVTGRTGGDLEVPLIGDSLDGFFAQIQFSIHGAVDTPIRFGRELYRRCFRRY